jgi:hypothetical protein
MIVGLLGSAVFISQLRDVDAVGRWPARLRQA